MHRVARPQDRTAAAGDRLDQRRQGLLNMFGAVFLVHALFGRRRTDLFYFFALCLVAAAYWQPALTKLKLNWIAHGQLYHMPLAAYAHGWLSFLDPETMVNFSRFVSWFDWPMRIFVYVVEANSSN